MRLKVVMIVLLGCLAVAVTRTDSVRSSSRWVDPGESKVQPKEVTLLKDSQSDKYGEVSFNHENHSIKKYSPDGTAVIACVDCHHTDQPAAALKPPLKTSERDAVLTTADLAKPDSKPVKTCRACHLQSGDDSAPMPAVTYEGKSTPTKLTNEVANHNNCNVCHDKAIAARPALKGKIPGKDDCTPCHKPVSG
jgi:cytochrome c553